MKRFVCVDIEMSEIKGKNRRFLHGMRSEVIQIGAVMLDENYNLISKFSTLVKPVYSSVTETIENLTGITNEALENADDFITAFDKYCYWVGDENVTTFCWSASDYNQLWNEIYLKARHRTDLLDVLKTFVDLQKTFCDLLKTEKPISLKSAVALSNEKFEGRQHTACSDAYNTAKILHKLCCTKKLCPQFEYLYLTVNPEAELLCGFSHKNNAHDSDFNYSMGSVISDELLKKFGCVKTEEKYQAVDYKKYVVAKRKKLHTDSYILNKFKKKFLCTKYDVKIFDWMKFYMRVMFTGKMQAA